MFQGAVGYGFHFTHPTSSKALNWPASAVNLISINCGQLHETWIKNQNFLQSACWNASLLFSEGDC
jgi:hypothetical protein